MSISQQPGHDPMAVKRWIIALLLACAGPAFFPSCVSSVREVSAPRRNEPTGRTFDMLDQYGEWIESPGLGEVWRPFVTYDWSPFTQGQWEWTDRGWMWMSDEPFGWVVYHYGNWDYLPGMGWVWLPGYDWSPARVRWYISNQYIGWAPAPPRNVILPRPEEASPEPWWTVVESRNFNAERVRSYRIANSSIPAGTVSERAPDVSAVEVLTGRSVTRRVLEMDHVHSVSHDLLRPRTHEALPYSNAPPQQPTVAPPVMNLPRGQERGSATPPATNPPASHDARTKLPSTPPVTNPPASHNLRTKPPSIPPVLGGDKKTPGVKSSDTHPDTTKTNQNPRGAGNRR